MQIKGVVEDYVPFMDLHPELKLVPTTIVDCQIGNFSGKYDYVQDFNRKTENGRIENFHLLVKDAKYGVLYHRDGLFDVIDKIALQAIYDSIDFIYKEEKSFAAIVKHKGKYGLFLWKSGFIFNYTFSIPTEYDSMKMLANNRIVGVKNGRTTYFDQTCHPLK